MSIKINYSNKISNKSLSNIVLFCNEKYNINGLKNYLSNSEYSYINDLLKTIDLKKSLFVFDINSKKKIILISIKKNIKNSYIENLGAQLYKQIQKSKKSEYVINLDTLDFKDSNFILLDSNIPHNYLIKNVGVDCVLTVWGQVAHEYAYRKIPVINK